MSTYGFISLGLIGGSIARAIREKQPDSKILAYNRSEGPLKEAISDGVVNVAVSHGDWEKFKECDYLFLCAPVQKNEEFLEELAPILPLSCLITDVGSVKTSIHKAAKRLNIEDHFIGGHPMAGSERVGYSNSKAILLQNAYYILTPTESVAKERVDAYETLVKSFGSIALILSYEKHDYTVAAISHLPHVIAASLVNLVKHSDYDDGVMRMVAAGGFKDITRIASSSSTMWQQICLTNTDNIKSLLNDYIDYLKEFENSLEDRDPDDLYNRFSEAREYRDSFTIAGSGPIKVSHELTVEIEDKAGAFAAIANILADNGISFKNIGVLHNREYQGGDIHIEFYSPEDLQKTHDILEGKGYTVHLKTVK